jgi:hypothetical protein
LHPRLRCGNQERRAIIILIDMCLVHEKTVARRRKSQIYESDQVMRFRHLSYETGKMPLIAGARSVLPFIVTGSGNCTIKMGRSW